jgi:hypothetical protein
LGMTSGAWGGMAWAAISVRAMQLGHIILN